MIEAWLSSSLTIRSVSPVIVGMTPVFAVNPDWNVRTAGVPLNSASSASSASCIAIVPAIVRTAPLPDAELPDRSQRSLAQPRVVGQPEVVVGRQGDQPSLVDGDDRALGAAHHAQRPVEVALAQGRQLVVEEGQRVGAAGGGGHAVQSMTTLPESPWRAAAKAASNSRKPKRWVMAGRMSSPDWSMTVILYQVSYISRP